MERKTQIFKHENKYGNFKIQIIFNNKSFKEFNFFINELLQYSVKTVDQLKWYLNHYQFQIDFNPFHDIEQSDIYWVHDLLTDLITTLEKGG